MSALLLKPALYAQGELRPVLKGGQCECGYLFFPMQHFGCEKCGRMGTALKPISLSGVGQLVSSCVVRVHADPNRIAPFIVGAIALDEGPVIRTILVGEVPVNPRAVRVEAVLVPSVDGDESQPLDLRFRVSRPA
jgi:uncharacterized protein